MSGDLVVKNTFYEATVTLNESECLAMTLENTIGSRAFYTQVSALPRSLKRSIFSSTKIKIHLKINSFV